MRNDNQAIAIVGIGALFPKAPGAGFFWANVKNGVDGITAVPATHWNPADYFDDDPKKPDFTYARRGGFLEPVEFNPIEWGLPPKDLEATDTSQLLGLVAAKMALDDAGIKVSDPKTARDRISVILGVTGTLELVVPLGARLGHPHWRRAMKDAGIPDDAAKDAIDRISDSYVPWQENSFPGLLGNVVAGRIANKLDLHGTNCVVDAACASSLSAIHLAMLELQTGKADVAVSGGVDTFNDIFMFMCFSKTPALSPSGDVKPFDESGDGTILGEGLGIVVLKRLADAQANGDRIYAVIRGLGTSSDGKGHAIYAPSADGQKRCLTDAYTRAGIDPRTVDLVEAHGTGTKVGDATEATALTEVFRREPAAGAAGTVALGSVKSQIGHTKAAAGAASLIKATLALHHKVLPPTLKVSKPVEPLMANDSPFYVNGSMRPWVSREGQPRRAGLSAFGFGGSNFHAVLEESSPKKVEPDWDGATEIFALTAATPEELCANLKRVPTAWPDFAIAAEESRTTYSASVPFRLVLAAHRERTDLPRLIASAKAQLDSSEDRAHWSTPDGAHFGRGPAAGQLAVLFPGQGSQTVGMLRDLACLFPEMLDTLEAANAAAPRLSDFIYPPTRYDDDSKRRDEMALRATNVAQPALGAVSFGAWRVLSERFGVAADAFAGHSYGELPALAAAGRISTADLFALSRRRGELMAAPRDGDPGSMLAVLAPLADIEAALRESKLQLVIANRNAPQQAVLSGPTLDIEKAVDLFRGKTIRTIRLPVAAAFHSALVADAARPFRDALEKIELRHGSRPVFSNTIAAEYPADAKAAKDLLGRQLANPVEFTNEILALARSGVRTFLEVGPGSTLTRLIEAILEKEPDSADYASLALDAGGGRRPGPQDLANALAKLAARGHAVRLMAWEAESRCRPRRSTAKPGLTIPICGANYRAPHTPRPPRAPRPAETPAMPVPPSNDPLSPALAATQATLAALQRLQEQTAQLHKQFLDSQEQAQRTLAQLVAQQSALFGGAPMPPVTLPSPTASVAMPAPRQVPAPPVVIAPRIANGPPAPRPAGGATADILLAVVAEKTGYPVEMLDLGMSLDADLGIDSIKRVEILSALQEKLPAAPTVKPEHLGSLQTLQDVANFLANAEPASEGDSVETISLPDPHAPSSSVLLATAGLMDFSGVLLGVVAEKTGYPVEMLDLDMSLDADLGIDSIKRVEILSALQEKLPDAPVVKPEHLGSLRTLHDVIDFLGGRSRSGPETAKVPLAALAPPTGNADIDARALELLNAEPEPPPSEMAPLTEPVSQLLQHRPGEPAPPPGEPTPPPRLPATDDDAIDRSIVQAVDVDQLTGRPRIAYPEKSAIWLIAEEERLATDVAANLAALGFAVARHNWAAVSKAKPPSNLAALVLLAPPRTPPGMPLNRLAFQWVQHTGPRLRATARNSAAAIISIARLDGAFGLLQLGPGADPLSGGLAGIVKTVRHEWPELAVKAVDLSPAFADAAGATAVIEEILAAGPLEIGLSPTHRCTLELARTVRRSAGPGLAFGPKDVILVTGGGRGVTAEAAIGLAETYKATLILTGRTPPPTGPEAAWARNLNEEPALKAAAVAALPGLGPKQINEAVSRVLAQREVRETIRRIERAGGKAVYNAVNVAQQRAVSDLIHQVKLQFGPITGLIHGAGVLADRRLENLTPDQFDHVFNTKVDGARHLLELLSGESLKAVVLFGSTTGRFGRVGQTAYAAANEVLNKIAHIEARLRPNARVVCINWGPWEGGMVTPALRKIFEAEGIGLIPLADGSAFLIHEMNASGRSVEVVALGGRPRGSQGSLSGSVRQPIPAMPAAPPTTNPPPDLIFTFERSVDVATHPILRSHVLDGRAVLPMAVHMEWLAHAALHGNPGLVFHGFNDLRITHGVMIEDGAASTLRLFAGRAAKQDKLFTVPVELRGRRKDGREVIHSRTEVVLSAALPKPPVADRPPLLQPYSHPLDEIYKYFLFHGPDLHGIESVAGMSDAAFVGTAYPAPPPAEWFAGPLRSNWVADPLALDASFQMMILWSFAQHGAGSLPCFLGRYRQFRRAFPSGPVKVVIRVNRDNGSFARADIDYLDADGLVVAQGQDYECVIDPGLNQAFRRNQLAAAAVRS